MQYGAAAAAARIIHHNRVRDGQQAGELAAATAMFIAIVYVNAAHCLSVGLVLVCVCVSVCD